MNNNYVHGYDWRENIRLQDQASTLVDLLHSDTLFPAGSSVLEAGCGVGAQTITLVKNSPEAHITSIDISEASVAEAKKRVESEGFSNVCFQQDDIFNLSFEPKSFDHVFICFVLEHLSKPVEALSALKKFLLAGVLKKSCLTCIFVPTGAAILSDLEIFPPSINIRLATL